MAAGDPEKVSLTCACGGTTTVVIVPGVTTAIEECACGRMLLWSDGVTSNEAPLTLSLSVGESVGTEDQIT